ncbi:Nn.00g000810.m01.CDS01 [Neocucurbitaria sp. VM-36]
MADLEPKKSGFRAMFGMRSSKEPGSRKKLSKKGSASGPSVQRFDSSIVANPQRQDSGSFTSQSIDLSTAEALLPTYEDVTGLTSRNFRDSPYAATRPTAVNNHAYLQPPQLAEYRRNSEGQEQYAAPLYKSQSSRSASTPHFPDVLMDPTIQPVLVTKAQPAKLSKAHRAPTRVDDILDKDTGERKDLTDMMHAFTFNEELDIIDEKFDSVSLDYDPSKPDGTAILGSASPEIWLRIADFLSPLDVANLSSTCRTMSTRLGRCPYKLLLDPKNRPDRLDFLLAMDYKLPRHLLCFPCAQWHLRIQPGLETLKPHNVLNPLFDCPNRTNILLPPPRIRISDGRTLPFAFIQLARRSWEFGPEYGIRHQSLARRWKDPYSDWTHESTYHVTETGHVLMRVKSQHYVEGGMTDAAKRLLLFSRGDYTPYFSVCSHWKNGILTSIPKCALDHIPFVPVSEQYAVSAQLRDKAIGKKSAGLVSLCSQCRPMRRCPECPTEYLFELKFVEDKTVRGHGPERFKQALLVTRWSDLGPARSPADAEWSAIVGENEKYDSFLEIGRRAVSGVFESAFTDTVPGQRILSMNPKKLKADEIGGDWY